MKQRAICFGIFIVFILLIVACSQPSTGDKSILLVTIANFRGDDLGCASSRDSVTPQLDDICGESVRFTHAYTPSVLVNPALASILTGLYPVESGVHRNDAGRYAEGVKPLPLLAHEAGLETILVSGGVPVLRKTPLSKGFDDFDDSIRVGGSFYRPADEVVKRFLSLVENRAAGTPFFGVLHFADLQFPEIISLRTNQNEKREGNEVGKLQEIDDAIGTLKQNFRKSNIWDRLTVVIVGLQGTERSEHNGLSKGINLFDEIVRVPLLIKPSRKPTDHAPSWKVDEAVSLVDVGLTLFHLLGIEDLPKSKLPSHELLNALDARDSDSVEQPLFCESDLPVWRNWGPRIVSMRAGEWAYLQMPEQKLFNTYTDRLEQHNLFPAESSVFLQMKTQWQEYKTLMQPEVQGMKYFLPFSISEKLRIAKLIYSRATPNQEKLRELYALNFRRSDDWQVVQWTVQFLMDLQDWNGLKRFLKDKVATTSGQKLELSNWQALAMFKLKPESLDEKKHLNLDCLYLAIALKRFSIPELEQLPGKHQCGDSEILLSIKSYLEFKQKHLKEAAYLLEAARNINEKRVEQTEFAKQFWIDGATWDYKENLPAGPSSFDMFMTAVTNQEFITYIKKK